MCAAVGEANAMKRAFQSASRADYARAAQGRYVDPDLGKDIARSLMFHVEQRAQGANALNKVTQAAIRAEAPLAKKAAALAAREPLKPIETAAAERGAAAAGPRPGNKTRSGALLGPPPTLSLTPPRGAAAADAVARAASHPAVQAAFKSVGAAGPRLLDLIIQASRAPADSTG